MNRLNEKIWVDCTRLAKSSSSAEWSRESSHSRRTRLNNFFGGCSDDDQDEKAQIILIYSKLIYPTDAAAACVQFGIIKYLQTSNQSWWGGKLHNFCTEQIASTRAFKLDQTYTHTHISSFAQIWARINLKRITFTLALSQQWRWSILNGK